MARVKGPLMSMSASGSIGDELTFRDPAGGTIVGRFVVPSDAKTGPQLALRGYTSLAVEFWKRYLADTDQSEAWTRDVKERRGRMSGYNQALANTVQGLYLADPLSMVTRYEVDEAGAVNLTLLNVADGTPGTEAGDFEVWTGAGTAPMYLYGSFPIVAGQIEINGLLDEGDVLYMQVCKGGLRRSGIMKLIGGSMPKLTWVLRTPAPAAADWDYTAFTRDSAYHDFDMSAVVPSGAVLVALTVYMKRSAVGKQWRWRSTSWNTVYGNEYLFSQVANIDLAASILVPIDATGKVSYYAESVNWVAGNVTVKGWFLYE